jgi:AcrR family transcriptional regulator
MQRAVAFRVCLIHKVMSEQGRRRFKPRPGGRSAKVRKKVLDAFIELVFAVGYESVTIEAVAKASGVHRSTIHRRWPTLDSLLVDGIMGSSQLSWTAPTEKNGLRDDLIEIARRARDDLSRNQALMRALNSRAVHNKGVAAVSRSFWKRRVQVLVDVVQDAVERRELPAGTNPEVVALALYSPLYMRDLMNEPATDPFITRLVDVVLDGGLVERSGEG